MWGKRRIVQEGIIPNVVCIAKWPRGVDPIGRILRIMSTPNFRSSEAKTSGTEVVCGCFVQGRRGAGDAITQRPPALSAERTAQGAAGGFINGLPGTILQRLLTRDWGSRRCSSGSAISAGGLGWQGWVGSGGWWWFAHGRAALNGFDGAAGGAGGALVRAPRGPVAGLQTGANDVRGIPATIYLPPMPPPHLAHQCPQPSRAHPTIPSPAVHGCHPASSSGPGTRCLGCPRWTGWGWPGCPQSPGLTHLQLLAMLARSSIFSNPNADGTLDADLGPPAANPSPRAPTPSRDPVLRPLLCPPVLRTARHPSCCPSSSDAQQLLTSGQRESARPPVRPGLPRRPAAIRRSTSARRTVPPPVARRHTRTYLPEATDSCPGELDRALARFVAPRVDDPGLLPHHLASPTQHLNSSVDAAMEGLASNRF
ncbi:hypothetical protein Purlil1_10295 [Purpureocillium lilacinum]|uniref:Uncharacterized protein n=1 Tax=Purpureocillium lilacinum TaxID=33203 RepID=A0ABR0BNX0_PURLI|nr:hypothetical protein Purlil1_10295 [Purpureocillium lilacinum]